MRRLRSSFTLVAVGVVALLAWYVLYTRSVVRELRAEAAQQGRMFQRVYAALADTSTSETARIGALVDLAQQVRETGVPLILESADGRIVDTANVPFTAELDGARMRAYVRELDVTHPPIVDAFAGTVHYGDSVLVRGLAIVPLLQAGGLGFLLIISVWGFRERGRAEREKVWAGMARESAHQLGTPLSSLAGWIELLAEKGGGDATTSKALRAMEQDLQRLDRVAHRFERIGRPPRRDPVDVAALVERMAAYFQARAPQLARKVTITAERPPGALVVQGDGVLLEWVLEVLVKNAIDALGGRGGHVLLRAEAMGEAGARLRVADDGPGIPARLRKRVFEAGYSTKERGWGIGLALARRIVEENHEGTIRLVETPKGATFDVILP